MKATEILDKIQAEVDAAREDATKFDGGTNAAGTRVRKRLQSIAGWGKDGRKRISETVAERKEAKK